MLIKVLKKFFAAWTENVEARPTGRLSVIWNVWVTGASDTLSPR